MLKAKKPHLMTMALGPCIGVAKYLMRISACQFNVEALEGESRPTRILFTGR